MKLSEIIIQYRNEHKMSQRQFGAQCALSTGYISLIEKEVNPQTGKRMVPTITVLNKIAKGMGITLDELLTICDDMVVDISEKSALISEDGVIDEVTAEIITLLSELSVEKKNAALNYIRFLSTQ